MEYEIDDLACECWDPLDEDPRSANHAPRWTHDCGALQTGVLIPEETVEIDFLVPVQ